MDTRKLVKGVTVRADGASPKIRLDFTYKSVRCRETLALEATPKNIQYATRLLGEIKNKIALGTFKYGDYFPNSPKLEIFGASGYKDTLRTAIQRVIDNAIKRKASPNTIDAFERRLKSLPDDLLGMAVTDIDIPVIKQFIMALDDAGNSLNTVRCKLGLIRQALDEAVLDGLMTSNPARNIPITRYIAPKQESDSEEDDGLPDPFNLQEKEKIIAACRLEEHANIIEFMFETGMRPGEVIALQWDHIDWMQKFVKVSKSMARNGIVKSPKTKAGNRRVDLSEAALAAVQRQRKYTEFLGKFVFLDPGTNEHWKRSTEIMQKAWRPALKRAKVRYRKVYNTRHTFATMHISQGANLWWIAKQMGHRSPDMLFKHYGTYLEGYDNAQNAGQNLVQKTAAFN